MEKSTKRWLSLMLTLVMLLGMVPAFSGTARAETWASNRAISSDTVIDEDVTIDSSDGESIDVFVGYRNRCVVTINGNLTVNSSRVDDALNSLFVGYSSRLIVNGDLSSSEKTLIDPYVDQGARIIVTGDIDINGNVENREGIIQTNLTNIVYHNEPKGDFSEYFESNGKYYSFDGSTFTEIVVPVSYVSPEWNDSEMEYTNLSTTSYTEVNASTTAWSDGDYVVNSDVTINSGITVSGNVNLILCDGVTLTANQGINASGGSLTVYAQSQGDTMGALKVTGAQGVKGADGTESYQMGTKGGIGGTGISGNVTINGGKITATGGKGGKGGDGLKVLANPEMQDEMFFEPEYTYEESGSGGDGGNGISGSITINGGTVTAKGGAVGDAGINADSYESVEGKGFGRVPTLGGGVAMYEGTSYDGTFIATNSFGDLSTCTDKYICYVCVPTFYTVTFLDDNGEEILSGSYCYGIPLAEIAPTEIDDGTPIPGWQIEDEDGELISFDLEDQFVEDDITLYAEWSEGGEIIAWESASIEFTDGSDGHYWYDGNTITPDFIVTDGEAEIDSLNYEVSGDSATEVGKHTIIVTPNDPDAEEITADWYIEIDWSKAAVEFANGSYGLYPYTGSEITPDFSLTMDGQELVKGADQNYVIVEGSEASSSTAGLHTITVADANNANNTFDIQWYIYNLTVSAANVDGSDTKLKFTAKRNTDKANVSEFGMVFDRKGLYEDDVLSLDNKTNVSKTNTKTTTTYNVTVVDAGSGVKAKPYMKVTVNGTVRTVYGGVTYGTRALSISQIPEIVATTPAVTNGKLNTGVEIKPYTSDYELIELGVLFSKNGAFADETAAEAGLTMDNVGKGDVVKACLNESRLTDGQTMSDYSVYKCNISFVGDDPIYTKAYAIVKNGSTEQTIFLTATANYKNN